MTARVYVVRPALLQAEVPGVSSATYLDWEQSLVAHVDSHFQPSGRVCSEKLTIPSPDTVSASPGHCPRRGCRFPPDTRTQGCARPWPLNGYHDGALGLEQLPIRARAAYH